MLCFGVACVVRHRVFVAVVLFVAFALVVVYLLSAYFVSVRFVRVTSLSLILLCPTMSIMSNRSQCLTFEVAPM